MKHKVKHNVTIDGVEMSLARAGKMLGINHTTLYNRIKRGMTAQEAIEAVKIEKKYIKARFETYNGETLSLTEWSKASGVPYQALVNRLHRGMSFCDAIEKEVRIQINDNRSKHINYGTYTSMIDRCYNTKSKDFPNYGARGITVCDSWKDSFWNFVDDMGAKADKTYSIDRKDPNGNYCKDNCKWATVEAQNRNKRTTPIYTIDGISDNIPFHAKRLGINPCVITSRLRKKWPIEKAFAKTEKNLNQLS